MTADLGSLYAQTFYETANRASSSSARVCAPLVVDLLHPASVVDVGCGQGEWLAAFAALGVADYRGVDGCHVADLQLAIPRECFTPHDLTHPLRLGRRFDLAVSLEVAEHLSAAVALPHVETLADLAPAVLFSAAVPGQGGVHHVNEQWPWWWNELFSRRGYVQLDPFRQAVWKNPNVAVYYQHNMFLYVDPAVHQPLIDRLGVPDKYTELTLVRTTILQELTRPRLLGRVLRRFARLFATRSQQTAKE